MVSLVNSYMKVLFVIIFCTISLFSPGCIAMTSTEAERCVLIDLKYDAGRELLPELNRFSVDHQLIPELSHPLNSRFLREEEGETTSELTYRIGFGDFGAVLALFRYDRERDDDLLDAFDHFAKNLIEEGYKVEDCDDVSEFQLPESHR